MAEETDSAQCSKCNTFRKHFSSKVLTLTLLDDIGNLIGKKIAPSQESKKAIGYIAPVHHNLLRLLIDPTSGSWLLLLSEWAVSGVGLSGRGSGGVGVASSVRTLLEDSCDCWRESI